MADVFGRSKRSEIMSRVRSHGNKLTELTLIQIFREQKVFGWRRGIVIWIKSGEKRMAIKPEFVFRKRKTVVFVDGEFWHGHPTRSKIPKTNQEFWLKKIAGTKLRDRFKIGFSANMVGR